MENCDHGKQAPAELIRKLHESQAGTGRHRCPICAYQLGREYPGDRIRNDQMEGCQVGKEAPLEILQSLPPNQGGSGRHKCVVCAFNLGLEHARLELASASALQTEQITHGIDLESHIPEKEGRKLYRLHAHYERNSKNRAAAIRLHGTKCIVCGFDFDSIYGAELARSYIEIHHLQLLSELGERTPDIENDLAPLCANCHSMAHRRGHEIVSVEELRDLIKSSPLGLAYFNFFNSAH